MSHVRTYNPSVRVGNWSEDLQLEEDVLKDFLEKREKGELMIQRISSLSSSVLSEVALSISRDGAVHFGDCIMLVNPAAEDQTKYNTGCDPRQCSVVSANPSGSDIMQSSSVQECPASGSQCIKPSARNVFRIESVDGTPKGEPLRYGQQFQLHAASELTQGLCLFSDNMSFGSSTRKSRKQPVLLSPDSRSYQSRWMVMPKNPQVRFEYEGAPVAANEVIILFHCKTNQALAVESGAISKSVFGKEYEVSCCTYLDSHKAEMSQNYFVFTMNMPGQNVAPPKV